MGSEDKKLYAIESSSTRLADVYWPMLHHDVRHTGRNYTNQEPTSDAGEDQTVTAGDTVTLNGSNSSDPDYGIPLYEWTQTDEGTSVTLSDATAVKPTFTAPDVENDGKKLTFELKVTDNSGKWDTDTCDITVEEDDNSCFISTAGSKTYVSDL